MQAVPKSQGVERAAHDHLRLGVAAANACHQCAASGGGHDVGHNPEHTASIQIRAHPELRLFPERELINPGKEGRAPPNPVGGAESMTRMARAAQDSAEWDRSARAHIASRAADAGWKAYWLDLWEHHFAAGFANGHFVRELTKGEDGPFFERVWEMMLGRHLVQCGYDVISPPEPGRPDFRCAKSGTVTWVEATCATAGRDVALASDADWLRSSGYVPHDNLLLRWTNALQQKIKQCAAHRRAGIVAPGEGYLIVINGGLIATGNWGFGVSQLPFVVEATLAVGALQFSYDRETLAFKGAEHRVRTHAVKENAAAVGTAAFYDRSNAGISALVGCGSMRVECPTLPLLVAHNPLADRPFPTGILGPHTREWAASLTGRDEDASYWEIAEVPAAKVTATK